MPHEGLSPANSLTWFKEWTYAGGTVSADSDPTAGDREGTGVDDARSRARTGNELMADMVDVLQESQTVKPGGGIDLLVDMLGQELGSPVEPLRHEQLRPWLLQLVGRCSRVPDGLTCLARCLGYVEQQSDTVASLWRLADEWEAVDFFGVDLRPLRQVLQEMQSPAKLTSLARRASRSRTQELPAWCDTGWAVFLRLAGDNTAARELPVSMVFLALAAEQFMADGHVENAEHLRRWNRRQAADRELTDQMADWQRSREAVEPQTSLLPAYLMIQFEPDGVDPERYYVSHWRQSDTEGWHPIPGETLHLHHDELPSEVEALIERTEERWSDLRQSVVLEFILPWELLKEPVEWWVKESDSLSPTPLVMDYAVLIRSFERLRKAAWHRPWHNKWRLLSERPADTHAYWNRPGTTYFHLERELKEDEHAVCLVLAEPPGTDSPSSRQEYVAGLRSGVPAMIWHRGDCSDPAFKEAVADIVQDRGLAGLVERTWRWRKEALALGPDAWEGHVGRHLAILLDDPERRPGPPGPDPAPVRR